MIYRILEYGEPELEQVCEPVTVFDDNLKEFANNLLATIRELHAMGLAAPQVGVLKRIYVMDLRGAGDPNNFHYLYDGVRAPLDLFNPLVIINPELELLPGHETVAAEGCMSFPDLRINIKRPTLARTKFQDLNGEWHTIECEGYAGHCLQHEHDHLDGILFTKRATVQDLDRAKNKIKKIKRISRDNLKFLKKYYKDWSFPQIDPDYNEND